MRHDVVFIVLTLASRRKSDAEIIQAVYDRLGVQIGLAEVETILTVNEWMEAA